MVSTRVDIEEAAWTPGTPFYGPAATYDGTEIIQLKVLSDRRQDGGGIALLVKASPPPGKLIKIIATARSERLVNSVERHSGRYGPGIRTIGSPRPRPRPLPAALKSP
jgi:hypothetical protein